MQDINCLMFFLFDEHLKKVFHLHVAAVKINFNPA